MIWKILEIEKTKDREAITAAYREKLRYVNPEDDEQGFMELRRAYEEALEYAAEEENGSLHNIDDGKEEYSGKKDEVDFWIDRVDAVYQDVALRRDEACWKKLLQDAVCDDLDTELEAAEKLLVFFMSHSFLPQQIWKLIDKRFRYMENFDQLKEQFPENYLSYVKWQIESPGFIDFDLFDGDTSDHVDDYISKLYEIRNLSEERKLPEIEKALKELKRYELTHPYAEVEEARYRLQQVEESEGEKRDILLQEAMEIMEDLDFAYSDNSYIERTYAEVLIANGEIAKARAIYDTLIEKIPDNYTAMLGLANCIFLEGNPEEAKERIEDILEEHVQDVEALALLDKINKVLVEKYEEALKEKPDRETSFKLGWCYYQQKRFEEGIAMMDALEEGEDYDYINLRCRLYLANEEYEKGYPQAKKWLSLIEATVDDGTKEMARRKNRLSLAHFSLGVCVWEAEYKKRTGKLKEKAYEEASCYIQKAIQEEQNALVKLSYMEQLARFYLEAKHYTECIETCNAIIAQDKGFFPAYVHRQRANYELKNAKEVVDDYFVCREIYPTYVLPYVLAAEVFFAFEQYDDVEQIIEAAREEALTSDSLELYRIKCIHYKEFSRENTESALKAMIELREKVYHPEEGEETDIEELADLEREYAVLYWDLDQVEKTIAIIDAFLEKHPDSESMCQLKIDVSLRENRVKEALSMAKKMAKAQPDNLQRQMKLGNCYERTDQLLQAIKIYQMILDKQEDYVPAIRRLMYIYSYLSNKENDLEKCKKAISYADKMIALTDAAEAYLERGNLKIDIYELEEAVADCQRAIELEPDAYYAYNNLGCALLKLRRVEEAIPPLLQAIALDPDKDHLPYMNLSECYALLGEYDKAIQAYEEVLRLRPNAENIRVDIAGLQVKKKDYKKAVLYYQKRIRELEEKQSRKGLLGKIVSSGLTLQEEEQLYSLYCDIADVYRQSGDKERAELYYNKVLTRWKNPLLQKLSCRHMVEIAEYFRDCGELEKAEKLIRQAYWRMTDADMHSREWEHLLFVSVTILFEVGNQKRAREDAISYFSKLIDRLGKEEEIFADKRYLPMYLYDFGIISLCAGDLKEGKEYLERIKDCNLCVTCECMECFEYYFGMGILAEIEGRKEEAKQYYRKAIALKGDYPCASRHLKMLKE